MVAVVGTLAAASVGWVAGVVSAVAAGAVGAVAAGAVSAVAAAMAVIERALLPCVAPPSVARVHAVAGRSVARVTWR